MSIILSSTSLFASNIPFIDTISQYSALSKSHSNSIPVVTTNISFPECADYVLSGKFLNFWKKDLKNPCVTVVGQSADKLAKVAKNFWEGLWIKQKEITDTLKMNRQSFDDITQKREITDIKDSDYFNYRHGFFFKNWPPFSFTNEDPGWQICEQAIYDFPKVNQTNKDDSFLMSLSIVNAKNCFLFKEQQECINTHLGDFFNRSSKYHNAEVLFIDRSSNYNFDGTSMKKSSEILPLNWTVNIFSTQKLSPEFLAELKAGLEGLTDCEKKAYLIETLGFGLFTGGASLIGIITTGLVLYLLIGKNDKPNEESELTSVLIGNSIPKVNDYKTI